MAAMCGMMQRLSLNGAARPARVSVAATTGRVAAATVGRVGMVVVAAQNKVKRARQNETRRAYHKQRRSEMATRMKKVFVTAEEMMAGDVSSEADLAPLDTLISEAYKCLDKGVKTHTIKLNTASRRKARLAKAKKAIEIEKGLYVPAN